MVGKLAPRDSRLTSSQLSNSPEKRKFPVLQAYIPSCPGKVLIGSASSLSQLLQLGGMALLGYLHIMAQGAGLHQTTPNKE